MTNAVVQKQLGAYKTNSGLVPYIQVHGVTSLNVIHSYVHVYLVSIIQPSKNTHVS